MQYVAFLQYLGTYNIDAATTGSDLQKLSSVLQTDGIASYTPTAVDAANIHNVLQTEGASVPGVTTFLENRGFTTSDIQLMLQQALASPLNLPTESAAQALGDLANLFKSSSVSTSVRLAFGQQPSNATANNRIAPAVLVYVEDANGNVISGDSSVITLSLASGQGGMLSGTVTVAAVNGVATFSNLSLNRAGTYTLAASDGDLPSITSNYFAINYASQQLVFAGKPTGAVAGAKLPRITVNTDDASANLVPRGKGKVTLKIFSGPVGGKLVGTTTATTKNGVAIFGNISIQKAGTYTLSATENGYAVGQSDTLVISPAAARKMVFNPQPHNVAQNAPFNVEVQLLDRYGNLGTGDSSTVTLALGSHPRNSVLTGVLSEPVSDGLADFTGLSLDIDGSYTVTAEDGRLKVISKKFAITG